MTLAEMLGDGGLNLTDLPVGALAALLKRRRRTHPLDLAYATAATAETGLFNQAAVGRLDWPLRVTDTTVRFVEYCSDCYDYSCPHDARAWSPQRDLCVFSSHYAKLADLLGPAPERALADQPADVYKQIESSKWEMVHKDHDPDGIARRVVTLFWHIKARIILNRIDREDALAEGLADASQLLEIPEFHSR